MNEHFILHSLWPLHIVLDWRRGIKADKISTGQPREQDLIPFISEWKQPVIPDLDTTAGAQLARFIRNSSHVIF